MSKHKQRSGGQAKGNPADHKQPGVGKVDNDRNKAGAQDATQVNEAHRTPQSRHDRESRVGSSNQPQSQKGSAGGGRK